MKFTEIDRLCIVHRSRDNTGTGMPDALRIRLTEQGFFLGTCMREFALLTRDTAASVLQADTIRDAGLCVLEGSSAYAFLLQTTTGLNSSVPGETNIQGQVRKAWDAWRQDAPVTLLNKLDPVMHELFIDARNIRRQYLQGIGGNSYGSLVRKLMDMPADARVLIVGAGDLAQSITPFFSTYETRLWNRHATDAAQVGAQAAFAPGAAADAAQWATHVVLTTPPNEKNDRQWAMLLRDTPDLQHVVHLGIRRAQRGPWKKFGRFNDLDDVVELRQSQSSLRARKLDQARQACEQRALDHVPLRLGTRASLLAVAQSRLVAEQLVHLHPDLQVELVELDSRGDKDQATPLSSVTDTQFFSDELDAALAAGDVDFCVHSWKDIDGPRPESFVRAAVPARALPHDVILFRSDVEALLAQGQTLRIGTSSQRRKVNTADFLGWALPCHGSAASYEFHDLRGPVHERLARILEGAGEARLDGVVLALAGLARLWQDPSGRAAIEPLLRNARWMIMPLSECPAAPAQGALAVETLRDNQRCRALLETLHHEQTEQLVQIEQQMLRDVAADAAGFGATAEPDPVLGHVARLRGRSDDNARPTYATQTAVQPATEDDARAWDAASWRRAVVKQSLPAESINAAALFVAHADAYSAAVNAQRSRCWTSGPRSWAQLARQGLWIEGCADNLGFEHVKQLLATPVLQLPKLADWVAVTHKDAVAGWVGSGIGTVIPTYSIAVSLDTEQVRDDIEDCTHFFWASARQYHMLKDLLPPHAYHACGAGKTYHALREAGTPNLQAFPSRREWQQWLA